MRGLPYATDWIAASGSRLPRNDNMGEGVGGVGCFLFSGVFLYAVIASPLGRGNPVGDDMREAGAMWGLPAGSTGLPRRGFAPPRNDKGGDGVGEM